jgi:hypothetical protein
MVRCLRLPTAWLLLCLAASWALADNATPSAESLRKRREALIRDQTVLLSRIGLGSTPVAELEALAKRQKQELIAARDDCRRAQQAAIDMHAAAIFREIFREEKRRSLKRLQDRADTRRNMITRNNELIAANEVKIEAAKKQLSNPPRFGTQETWDRYHASNQALDDLVKSTEALKSQNQAATRVIQAVEPALKGSLPATAAGIQTWQAQLNDAILQEKNTWDKQLAKWQRENEWARRVAAEMTLGMDLAVAESMNPEMILAELSPTFQEKLMRERAEMYDQMAQGVDSALRTLLEQAAANRAALAQLEEQLRRTNELLHKVTAQIIVEELPAGLVSDQKLQHLLSESDWASGFRLDGRLRAAVVEQFRHRRGQYLHEVQTILDGLAGRSVVLACSPSSNIPWNTSTDKIVVTVESEDESLGKAIAQLNYLCRRLCGVRATHPVLDAWTFPEGVKREGPPPNGHWPFRSRHSLTLVAPGKYTVALVRTLKLSVNPPSDRECPAEAVAAFNRQVPMHGQITIQVAPPEFPTQIAGRWSGSLVMSSLNYPHENGQGCAMLDNLKGQALGAVCTLTPSNFAAGTMELVITPPKGQASNPARLRYQNNNGAFTASGVQGNGTMTLKGTFRLNGAVWTLSGTWHWAGGGATAGGTWSVNNPNAK